MLLVVDDAIRFVAVKSCNLKVNNAMIQHDEIEGHERHESATTNEVF
jgi:hypothetical protein